MLTVLLGLAAQASSGSLSPAQPLPPPGQAEQAVLAPINALLAALSAGDSAGVLRHVFPDGRVTATGTRSASSGLRQESWAQFAGRVSPATAFQETIIDPAIEIDGDVALVWASYVVRIGGKVANCGIDHFDLVRDNGVWKVMNLSFSSRVTDCPQ